MDNHDIDSTHQLSTFIPEIIIHILIDFPLKYEEYTFSADYENFSEILNILLYFFKLKKEKASLEDHDLCYKIYTNFFFETYLTVILTNRRYTFRNRFPSWNYNIQYT